MRIGAWEKSVLRKHTMWKNNRSGRLIHLTYIRGVSKWLVETPTTKDYVESKERGKSIAVEYMKNHPYY